MPLIIKSRAFLVAQFLNVARGNKRKRFIHLMSLCVKLSELSLSNCVTRWRATEGPFAGRAFCDVKRNRAALDLVNALNQILSAPRYRGRRSVHVTLFVTPGEQPSWEHAWAPVKFIPFASGELGTAPEEGYAVEILLDLLAEGELWRLRQCSSCELWYSVHQKRQQACPSCAPKERLRRYMAGKG